MPDARLVTVGDIAEIIAMGPFGSNIKVETFQSDGIPIISGAHLHGVRLHDVDYNFVSVEHADRLGRSNVKRGDVIFTHAGNIGQVAYIPESSRYDRYIISQRQFYLRCSDAADPRYMAYYFRSPAGRHALLANASQVGVPSIARPASYLRSIQLVLPGKSEQVAIADTLSMLDDKIELNRRMNETLEAMAQAIFRDWFVDFGPVRRRMEGATDPAAIMGGLTSDPDRVAELAALFPTVLTNAGLPERWSERPLDQVAEFLNGLALQKYPAAPGGASLPVIKIAELRNGITEKSGRASLEVPAKYVIKDGDYLFSWSGSLVAKVWTEGPGALNQHLFKVSSAIYPQWFYAAWVEHHLPEFQRIAASKATTMGHIQRGHLSAATTVCPPSDAIRVMSSVLAPLWERRVHNELENRTLAETRDYLLPRLMSGQVRVGDALDQVSEAAA